MACKSFGCRTGRVSEWLAATLEMWCRVTGCEFESRALRFASFYGVASCRFRVLDDPESSGFKTAALTQDRLEFAPATAYLSPFCPLACARNHKCARVCSSWLHC